MFSIQKVGIQVDRSRDISAGRSGLIVNEVLNFWKYAERDSFATLYETAPIMMHSIDRDGVLLRVSAFWAEALGYKVGDMIGKKSTEFLTPESRKFAEEEVLPQFFRDGRIENADYQFVRADGSIIDVLLSAVAQTDGNGDFLRSLAIMFDNSDARRTMAMLQHKQRAESVGRLISGVAQDFNNSLSVIQGNLELMQDRPLEAEIEMNLLDAIRATRRAATMTRQLISIGQNSQIRLQTIDVNQVVQRNASILARLMPDTINVETTTNSDLWPARLDRHQLDTALLNLANNARQAMPDGGTLTLETSNVRLKSTNEEQGQKALEPGRYVMISVSDTGIGIDPADHVRVFDPHISIWPAEPGPGMGLAMVQTYMAQSKGAVRLHSEPGFGTTVKLYFPAVGHASAQDSFREGMDDDGLNAEHSAEILVVHDEDELRKVLVAQLKSQGYAVAQAANGDFALALIEAGLTPKVLISDMVLPGRFQGPALAANLRDRIPDLNTILLSGYSREDWEIEDKTNLRLTKPVSRRELISAVRSFD